VSEMAVVAVVSGMAVVEEMNKMNKMNEMDEMDGVSGMAVVNEMAVVDEMDEMDKMNRDGLISHIDFLVRLCLYDTAHAEPLSTAIIYGDALHHASYCPCWHP
jgi:hypothetical protein